MKKKIVLSFFDASRAEMKISHIKYSTTKNTNLIGLHCQFCSRFVNFKTGCFVGYRALNIR